MKQYTDYWYKSGDGLTLYARDYQHPSPQATILCIPGLTRNSADFAGLCEHLADRFRVIVADLRGRGKSDYDPDPNNYHPGAYLQDIVCLLDSLKLDSVVLIGTSLGGLLSMLLASFQPERVAAMVVNDIGPEVNKEGMERIKSYVCNPSMVNSWDEAIAKTREVQGREFPDFNDSDWDSFARNLFRENGEGRPVLNYDLDISKLLLEHQDDAVPPDLWPVFKSIQTTPLLLLRGELSDLLSAECVSEMRRLKPNMQFTEVPNRGHAPTLTEAVSIQAIDRFLTPAPPTGH